MLCWCIMHQPDWTAHCFHSFGCPIGMVDRVKRRLTNSASSYGHCVYNNNKHIGCYKLRSFRFGRHFFFSHSSLFELSFYHSLHTNTHTRSHAPSWSVQRILILFCTTNHTTMMEMCCLQRSSVHLLLPNRPRSESDRDEEEEKKCHQYPLNYEIYTTRI